MNDDELMELFSAFDDVSASESLQSSTLDFIMGAAAAAPATAEAEAPASQTPTVTATRGAKARMRNRWRAMRTAAVAACLALALTGGAAYAYPASTVVVMQGETTIELHVNVFGQVLSASASDDETQDIIDQMGLVNTPFSDSVSRVSDSLKESNPQVPVAVVMNGVPQPAELGTESLVPPAEKGEPAPDAPAPVPDEPAPVAEEPAVVSVVSEPVASNPAANVEATAYLPEPSLTQEETDTPSEPENGGRSSREPSKPTTDTPEKPSNPSPTPTPDPGESSDDPIDIVEPVQPVVVDDPDDSQVVVVPDDGNDESDSQSQPEETYEKTRSPRYHGDDEF